MGILDYIGKRGGSVVLEPVPVTDTSSWKKASDVMVSLLEFEVRVSNSLHNLLDLAKAENDSMTEVG